ncbi:hypothetical protein ACQZV8_20305, partial [Magnetococcales bacterium HHB-1]
LTSLIFWVPFAERFRAPGVVQAKDHLQVVNDSPGYVTEIFIPSGQIVEQGTPLLKLSNRELELDIQESGALWQQILIRERQAERAGGVDLQPIRRRKAAIRAQLDQLKKRQSALIIQAKKRGLWVAPDLGQTMGVWIQRGLPLGMLVSTDAYRFSAVVSQEEASNLFSEGILKAEVRLFGRAEETITVTDYQIIPFQHQRLPSAALGWLGGGDVAVTASDQSGLETEEPFFRIDAELNPTAAQTLFHGQAGRLRLTLPEKPLFKQWMQSLRQVIQKRYGL